MRLMRFVSIASGSSGNCIYTGNDNTNLLIDAGISGKRIESGLNGIGLKGEDINAILITHEHADHTASVGVMLRRYGMPVYATRGTAEAILSSPAIGNVDEGLFNIIESGSEFTVGSLKIYAHPISHDAADPVAYRISDGNVSAGICTDLGKYDDATISAFYGVNVLLLEANHDVNMLQVGRYPYPLKRRILSDRGHLSNEAAGALLCKLVHDDLKAVLLGHLSAENNLPELCYEAVRLELLMGCDKFSPEKLKLKVASRSECSEVIDI